MEDYTGNSKKVRETATPKQEKVVEKVVVGDVVVQKRGIGRKLKDVFVEADVRSVSHYVIADIVFPALKNLMVDSVSKGVERMAYGESATRRRGYGSGVGPRVTYNNPINRGYREGAPSRRPSEPRSSRRTQDDFILSSRDEAESVLERMNDIIDNYEVASVADLNELVGFPSAHTDQKWGWVGLYGVQIRQVREGYLLDLPPAEPIH